MTHILRISTWLAETYMLDNLTSENIIQLVQFLFRYFKITISLGLAGLFVYVCALFQKRSSKIICSFLRIFKIARQTKQSCNFCNEIQVTMPLGVLKSFSRN